MPRFRSKLEACVAKKLDLEGHVYMYEPNKIDYKLECNYTPDFVLQNGVHLEIKGFFKPSDRRKMLAVINQHPELDIRMVFQRNNPLAKNSKTTYGSWCEKHGIQWCIWPDIPPEWLT